MINTATLPLFLIAAITLALIPGPDMVYVMARSVGQGRKAGIVSAFGVSVGLIIHTSAAALGLSALLMSSAFAYSVVRYLGAAYLIYLGTLMVLSKESIGSLATLKQASLGRIFGQGIITNVLNPKIALFFLAFLPQFIDVSSGQVAWQILILGIIFNTIGTSLLIVIANVAGSAGNWLRTRRGFSHIQRWVTGSILIALGIRVAWPERS